MLPPDVKTVFKDEKLQITYEIWAYRKVTEFEVQAQIGLFLRQMAKKKKKLKPGKTYGIVTSYH